MCRRAAAVAYGRGKSHRHPQLEHHPSQHHVSYGTRFKYILKVYAYLAISSFFFHELKALVPWQRSHQRSWDIVCFSRGSPRQASGMSSSVRIICASTLALLAITIAKKQPASISTLRTNILFRRDEEELVADLHLYISALETATNSRQIPLQRERAAL